MLAGLGARRGRAAPSAPIVPVLLSLGLLVGGAVAAAFVLEPLGRIIGRPFEWFFGAQGLLGRANLSRDRARTGLTVGAMMIALAAVVALGTVAESARAGTERRVASILPGGHAIRSGRPARRRGLPGDVRGHRRTSRSRARCSSCRSCASDDGREEAALAGIDPNVFARRRRAHHQRGVARRRLRRAARRAARCSCRRRSPIAPASRSATRSALALPGGEADELRVAGIVELLAAGRTADGALLVSSADARELFGATTASLWIMVPQPDVAASAFAASVRETAVQLAAEPLTARDLAGELSSTLDRLIGLFDVLALVAVVIGALGIVNTLGGRHRRAGPRDRHPALARHDRRPGAGHGRGRGRDHGRHRRRAGDGDRAARRRGARRAAAPRPSSGRACGCRGRCWSRSCWSGTGVAALAGLYPARVAASLPIVANLKHFE